MYSALRHAGNHIRTASLLVSSACTMFYTSSSSPHSISDACMRLLRHFSLLGTVDDPKVFWFKSKEGLRMNIVKNRFFFKFRFLAPVTWSGCAELIAFSYKICINNEFKVSHWNGVISIKARIVNTIQFRSHVSYLRRRLLLLLRILLFTFFVFRAFW